MSAPLETAWIRQRLADLAVPEQASPPDSGLTDAAVLVPLVTRRGGVHVILTRRATWLTSHAGQISFPGGRIECDDADPIAAALREAEEEIGVGNGDVEVVGRLPRYRTGTGFQVYPVVGFIDANASLTPCPVEVAEIFEVPLAFVLDARNHRPHHHERAGRQYRLTAIPYGEYYIWGATAGILRDLRRHLGY